jgi:CRP/FNR family transcriptional regulator, dissimilatory nitrate respiration regulator
LTAVKSDKKSRESAARVIRTRPTLRTCEQLTSSGRIPDTTCSHGTAFPEVRRDPSVRLAKVTPVNKHAESSAELLAALRRSDFLSAASDDAVHTLAAESSIRELKKGECFLREGEIPDCFGIVLSGHVRTVHYNPDGRPITIHVVWPGAPLALLGTLVRRELEGDIEAAEPSRVACIPRGAFEALLEREPRVSRALLSVVASQLYQVMLAAKSFGADVSSRLAHYIQQRALETAGPTGVPKTVDLGVSRAELAAQLGTVPETLSRAFASMEEDGVIEAAGRTITILDPAELADRALAISDLRRGIHPE